MRPSSLLYMYRRRLRSHGPQELLAGAGIAIAVALVFAAMLSQSSIESSAARVVGTLVGPASLQLRARGDEGFSEALLARVKRLRGVENAAPLLEETATLRSAEDRQARIQLAGADLRLAVLDGLAETLPIGSLSSDGIGISATVAGALRAGPAIVKGDVLTLDMRGSAVRLPVTGVLGRHAAGALADAYAAVMPLSRMQRLAGLPGQVSRIFVQTQPGMRAAVRGELTRLAGGSEEVAAADQDVRLLSQALGPSRLASGLFAAIGALLGFLLAFNAMLLTVADRRRTIADLRISGASRASIVEMVLFEALCLGVPASLLGLALGYELSVGVFHQSTRYLAEAFTLSGATSAHAQTIALPLLGGVLACCAASTVPLLDLRPGRARDAIYEDAGVPGHGLSRASKRRLGTAALCLIAIASGLWIALPSAAIPATALLALATVLCVPLTFSAVLRAATAIGERVQALSILPLALASLKATAIRSLALAATGAVALFGSVALGGARQNLLDGIGSFARSYVADAQVWVSNPGDNQATDAFAAGALPKRIARLPGVSSVQRFQGGFVQLGGRRVWVIARPGDAERHVLASQLRSGGLATALTQIAHGRAIALSQQIAAEHHVGIGGTLVLPTPSGPRSFRVAATTTNLAWPPGVIFISSAAYAAAWQTSAPTTLGVQLAAGADPTRVRQQIAALVGAGGGLEVSLASARAARIDGLTSEGLGQLRQVSTMLLLAAIVAMFAALVSSIWQRRAGLAGLRLFGAGTLSLQCILAIEALLILGAGCLTGAVAGIYGQIVIDAFLRHVTGFPLESPAASLRPVQIFVLVLLATMTLGAIPGWVAARVRPALAIANE